MRHAIKGKGRAPEWAICLEMAGGNPLLARQIYDELDAEWWFRWQAWNSEKRRPENK